MEDINSEFQGLGTICCVGLNYVGVYTSCVIASMCPTVNVAVVDADPNKICFWSSRQLSTREPGIEDIIKKCQNKNLVFTPDVEGAIELADLIFLSVSAPSMSEEVGDKNNLDLADIEKAAKMIAELATESKIVVEKSAVPVGHCQVLKEILNRHKNEGVRFQVLSNPEFFSPGMAIKNLMNPDRILIGSDETAEGLAAAEVLASIYAQWIPRDKIITMSNWSSELAKLSVNAFLAQRLSSVNALSLLCEYRGGDAVDIIDKVGKISGLGSEYMKPSLGFGGPFLEKDVYYLIYMCERLNLREVADYWKQVIEVNEFQKRRFKMKILSAFFNTMTNKKIAIWGISYKKNIDILENSPAVYICKSLLEEGAKLNIYDPKVEKKAILETLNLKEDGEKDVTVFDDPSKAAHKTNAIICCTDSEEFASLNFSYIYKDMLRPAYIFDGQIVLPHDELVKLGFIVKTIGKDWK